MTDSAASDPDVPETTPPTGTGDYGAALYIDANTLAFDASVQPPSTGLDSLITQLPDGADALLSWVPDITLDSVGVSFQPGTSTFGVYATAGLAGADGTASPTAQVFIADVPVETTTPTPTPSPTAFVVGVALGTGIELSGTPLFGSLLSGIVISDLTITYASAQIPAGAIGLPAPAPAPGTSPAYPAGPVLAFTLGDGTATQRFVLTPETFASAPSAEVDAASLDAGATEPPPVAPIQWFPVQQSIGPLTIGRIGIVSGDDQLGFALDASVHTAVLGIALTGFTLFFQPTSDISLSGLHVSLDGLAVHFGSGSLTIDGSLARTVVDAGGTEVTQYDGALLIQAGAYGIAAVGAFAQLADGSPSLFVFGMAKGQFGGPPAFFVTGLAAGFGYNRRLTLPAADQVSQFPFVLMATQGSAYLPDPDASAALAKLGQGGWVPPEQGQYWVAAGIAFSSFQLVDAFALLIVQFGNELVFALLGVAALALPKVGNRFAYAEMTLDAVLRPADGTFAMTALLTRNSYVLYPDCRLTGGFAFWLWFGGNEHAGDFVVTLGGYHPAFDAPTWYPNVPRLGFTWNVSSEVHLSGGSYFALTPSCAMGGGSLSLTFQSGDLNAWFDARADFVMWWKPFYFHVFVGVSIGASYTMNLWLTRKTFSVELSANVELWGPPLAGVAHVDWYIISFTIDINGGGSADPPGRALDWPTFSHNFLPGAQTGGSEVDLHDEASPVSPVLRCRLDTGLVGSQENGDLLLVSAAGMTLSTETVVPATRIEVAGPAGVDPVHIEGCDVGVYPMGSVSLSSTQTVTLVHTSTGEPVNLSGWTWQPVFTKLPYSLWGTQNNGATLSARVLTGLTGCSAVPSPPVLSGPAQFDLTELNAVDLSPERPLPLPTGAPIDGSTTAPTTDPRDVIAATIADQGVIAVRDGTIALLNQCGIGTGLVSSNMTGMAASVLADFQQAPMLGPLGSTGPRSSSPTQRPETLSAVVARSVRPMRPGVTRRPVVLAVFDHAPRRLRPGASVGGDVPLGGLTGFHALPRIPDTRSGLLPIGIDDASRAGASVATDTSSVWLLDPDRPVRIESDGGCPVRVLALDHRYRRIDETWLEGAGSMAVPTGTERLVLTGLARRADDGAPAPIGWHSGTRLLQVAAQAMLGVGCVLRPQAPRLARAYRRGGDGRHRRDIGVINGADLVADNTIDTDGGRRQGWLDAWWPDGTKTLLVTVRADGNGGADGARGTAATESAPTADTDELLVFADPSPAADPPGDRAGRRLAWRYDGLTVDGSSRLIVELPDAAASTGAGVGVRTRWSSSGTWRVTGMVGNPATATDHDTAPGSRHVDARRALVTLV